MLRVLLSCSALLILIACAGPADEDPLVLQLATPRSADPSDAQLAAAVKSFLTETGAPAAAGYDLQRVDLNNDGRRDALVLMTAPYGYWCGLHGCALLVMQAQENGFTLVNAIQPVRAPVYVSDINTHGWKNLIIRVSGRWDETRDVAMQFDGARYPANPASLPAYLHLASAENMRVFYGDQ